MYRFTKRFFILSSTTVLTFCFRRFSLELDDSTARFDMTTALKEIFARHQYSAEAIGWEHLCNLPSEKSRSKLIDLICAESKPPLNDPDAIKAWAREKIRGDFRVGRVVEVQGWILSATEARLCAFAALSSLS
jgi:hypothetical protein